MSDSNKKPAPATSGKPAGPHKPAVNVGAKAGAKAGSKGARPGAKAVAHTGKNTGKTPKGVKRADVLPAAPVVVAEVSPAKRALAWAHSARFMTTASQLHHLPDNGRLRAGELLPPELDDTDQFDDAPAGDVDDDARAYAQDRSAEAAQAKMPGDRVLPEIAFVGRSNAGKSTAINTLAQQKRLAFASKTPGRTQHINLFLVGPKDAPDALFADLPGYGYAAVARGAKLRWQRVMADYLGERESLSGVVLMVDSRLGLTDLDRQLLEFVSDRVTAGEVRLLVLLTKADKLNRKEGAEALAKVQKELAVLATEDSDIAVTLFSALNRQGLEDVAEVIYDWAHSPLPAASDDGDENADAHSDGNEGRDEGRDEDRDEDDGEPLGDDQDDQDDKA